MEIPKDIEACPLELAPTSPITCTLFEARPLTLLKENFPQRFNSSRKLGKMLCSWRCEMKELIPKELNQKVSEAILEMSSKGEGCVGVISRRILKGH